MTRRGLVLVSGRGARKTPTYLDRVARELRRLRVTSIEVDALGEYVIAFRRSWTPAIAPAGDVLALLKGIRRGRVTEAGAWEVFLVAGERWAASEDGKRRGRLRGKEYDPADDPDLDPDV